MESFLPSPRSLRDLFGLPKDGWVEKTLHRSMAFTTWSCKLPQWIPGRDHVLRWFCLGCKVADLGSLRRKAPTSDVSVIEVYIYIIIYSFMIYWILGQPEITIFMGKTIISQWILRRYLPSFPRDKATSVYFSTPVGVTVVIIWLLLGLHPQSIFSKNGFSRSIIASLAGKNKQNIHGRNFERLWWSCWNGVPVI